MGKLKISSETNTQNKILVLGHGTSKFEVRSALHIEICNDLQKKEGCTWEKDLGWHGYGLGTVIKGPRERNFTRWISYAEIQGVKKDASDASLERERGRLA